MTKEYLKEIIKKVDNRGEKNFSKFLKFIYNNYDSDTVLKLSGFYDNEEDNYEKIGKMVDFSMEFNERFPDFNCYIGLEDQVYKYGIRNTTNKDIYIINDNEYILKTKGYELHIKVKL